MQRTRISRRLASLFANPSQPKPSASQITGRPLPAANGNASHAAPNPSPPVPLAPGASSLGPSYASLPPCVPVSAAANHDLGGDVKVTLNPPLLPSSHPTSTVSSPSSSFKIHGRCTCAMRLGRLAALGNDLGEVRVLSLKKDGLYLESPVIALGSAVALVSLDREGARGEEGRMSLTVVTEGGAARSWWVHDGGRDLERAASASVRDIVMKGYVSSCSISDGRLVATVSSPDVGYGTTQHYFYDERAGCWMR